MSVEVFLLALHGLSAFSPQALSLSARFSTRVAQAQQRGDTRIRPGAVLMDPAVVLITTEEGVPAPSR